MRRYFKILTALILAAVIFSTAASAEPKFPLSRFRRGGGAETAAPREAGGETPGARRTGRGTPIYDTFGEVQALKDAGGWYCMRRKAGETPELPSEFSFIREHECYFLGPEGGKTVYLTFDAGYDNGNIEKVLDTLSAHSAHGAFFAVSNLIKTEPELVSRMADEGHLVCNHSMRHRDMRALSEDEFKDELLSVERLYEETTGHTLAKYYRPPRGEFNEANLTWAESLGYKTVLWSVAYADWDNDNQPDIEKSLALLKDRVHPGAIILLHPTSATNAALLDAFLTYLEESGYTFGSLDDLSRDAKKKE